MERTREARASSAEVLRVAVARWRFFLFPQSGFDLQYPRTTLECEGDRLVRAIGTDGFYQLTGSRDAAISNERDHIAGTNARGLGRTVVDDLNDLCVLLTDAHTEETNAPSNAPFGNAEDADPQGDRLDAWCRT